MGTRSAATVLTAADSSSSMRTAVSVAVGERVKACMPRRGPRSSPVPPICTNVVHTLTSAVAPWIQAKAGTVECRCFPVVDGWDVYIWVPTTTGGYTYDQVAYPVCQCGGGGLPESQQVACTPLPRIIGLQGQLNMPLTVDCDCTCGRNWVTGYWSC